MTRGPKREIIRLTNERDFPHLVELAIPPEGFRSVLLEIDAFHRTTHPGAPAPHFGPTIRLGSRHCAQLVRDVRLDPNRASPFAFSCGSYPTLSSGSVAAIASNAWADGDADHEKDWAAPPSIGENWPRTYA